MMRNRRDFLRNLGLSAAALPFVAGLPSLQAAEAAARRQRLIIVFSPNGTLPPYFWQDEPGPLEELKAILQPLAGFKERMLMLKGLSNQIRGDGDSHQRGISCLLTGIELLPGNIQGGSHTPAGWANGISIDQEIRNFLQNNPDTRTRFGSLEFGVAVPDRADNWTRMVYAGANKPLAPIDDPYQMLNKLYGQRKDQATLASLLDDVREDLRKVSSRISAEDRQRLKDHLELVRAMESGLKRSGEEEELAHPEPKLDPNIELVNDNTPEVSRMQIDLLVNSLANDMCRVATLQYMRSVGQTRMRWLDVQEGHHQLSHEPDKNKEAQEKLLRINKWFAGEVAYLARKLDNLPEPGAEGSMLDHTTIVWTNELGKGSSHTHNNIPFLLLGGGAGFRMGLSHDYGGQPHNRLLMSLAHSFGHHVKSFGNKKHSRGEPLKLA
ncbi:MAG: DUF1552 domain-containing protein [Roseibacillus sp.]|jgi:hypothetical protein|nr:DUF1552 domain-containing protein [Roseibacillus sp.]MDP7306049.1 DUF1552 domain-containing protein [Roseibacillus sp.]HJM65628.1 DUF1552 domain-containing protein [Roseibacillus sp.]|tara:strand:- start:20399 stop:21712 length:1314 start_codon:yes stop_codon:yes gene_type:complete